MKYLIALMFPLIAIADDMPQAAGFANNAGGWTIVTNRQEYCAEKNMRDGYAFGTNGKGYLRFCWLLQNDKVMVVFDNGQTAVWSVRSFEYLAAEPEINPS
jgi:hypothetical protein